MEKILLQLSELTWSKVIVGGLFAAVCYWAVFYDDGAQLESNIATLNAKFAEAERQLRETKEAMADAEKFEKAVSNNEVQFKKVLEYLPQEINSNQLTQLINLQAQAAGARVLTTKSRDTVEKKDFYEMTRLDFSLQGTFSQVVSFLSLVSKVPRLLTFDNLTLKLDRSASSTSPTVEIAGVLVGYRYVKEVDPAAADAAAGATTGAPSGTNP